MKSRSGDTSSASADALACKECGCALGDDAKVFPVRIEDGCYCPRCFYYKRAPQEADRWSGGAPVACSRCKHQTLSYGVKRACAACGFPHVTVLAPPDAQS